MSRSSRSYVENSLTETVGIEKKEEKKELSLDEQLDAAIIDFITARVVIFNQNTAALRLKDPDQNVIKEQTKQQKTLITKMEALIRKGAKPTQYKGSDLVDCVKASPLKPEKRKKLLDLIKEKKLNESFITKPFAKKPPKTQNPGVSAPTEKKGFKPGS